jgi:hypothetical protein
MHCTRLKSSVLLPMIIVAGVLAPWRISGSGLAAEATAECTTCCPEQLSRCVVCAEKCTSEDNHYDKGIGKCPVSGT